MSSPPAATGGAGWRTPTGATYGALRGALWASQTAAVGHKECENRTSAPRALERRHRPLELRHLVERVAEQPLGHAEVAQLLHAAARPHLGGVVGHEAAALREEPPVARRVRRLEQRHGARRPDALLQRLRAEQLEARHLVHLRQLPQVERALRPALLLAEVELVGEEVVDEGGEAGEVGVGHRDLGGVALLHADA
eukprot:CAMPEP_0185467092 /NCGR_PEP_ID=MMETSP1365-20130426/97058_1 /TAXON_ID=38817 /ORGANISM="Gephyrocapsa oceanica, Strain RCC1303" /LENGTH=195 /DNA_ID=CAMNT_0028073829 /DNA_START=402 /DNA_END=985 /DNA_ORIENTATION=+